MIDAVVFLEHEETFVTGKRLFDLLDPRSHLDLDITFLGLKFISSFIKRQYQEINGKTQKNNRQSLIADYPVGNGEYDFKQKFQRRYYQCVKD